MDYKVMRNNISDYLAELTAPDTLYHCGVGFTGLDENPNVNIDETAYIHNKSATKTGTGFARTFSYSIEDHVAVDTGAIELLRNVNRYSKTGTNAQLYYYRTDPCLDYSTGADLLVDIPCRRFLVTVEPGAVTGDALSSVAFSGTLHQSGDEIEGYITINPDDLSATFSTTKGSSSAYSYSSKED